MAHVFRGARMLVAAAIVGLAIGGAGATASPQDAGKLVPGVGYDPKHDPLVNPASMLAPFVAGECAENEWFFGHLSGSPANLNPLFQSSTAEFIVLNLLFDGLFTFNAKMEWKINHSVVASLEESPDHKVWTIKLKPGLKWQDGQPWTAHDVAYSWKEILDERVPCPAVKDGTDEIELCEAVDNLTVRMVHKSPLPTSKWNAQFPIIPKHIYEKGKAEDPTLKSSPYYSKINRDALGNGAYRMIEWKEQDKIVLERWEGFHGPRPHFQRIVFRIIPDQNSALSAFEKGDIDEVELTSKQFADATVRSEEFKKRGHKATAAQWVLSYIGWNMDGSNPFFADVRVRRAMTQATNIPLIIAKLAFNLPRQAHGIFHPDSWMFNPEIRLLAFDLNGAAKLLDEAGWTVSDEDGWRHKAGRKFSFTLLLPQGNSTSLEIAAVIQQDLQSIGVEMQTQVMEWASFQEKTRKHEFEAMIAGWGTGTDPDTTWNIWHSESYKTGRNYVGYNDPRVDELYALGRREFDPGARARIYQEIQKRIYDAQPYTFLWNRPTLWAFNRRIRGIQFSPRGVYNFDPSIMEWWVHKSERMRGSE